MSLSRVTARACSGSAASASPSSESARHVVHRLDDQFADDHGGLLRSVRVVARRGRLPHGERRLPA